MTTRQLTLDEDDMSGLVMFLDAAIAARRALRLPDSDPGTACLGRMRSAALASVVVDDGEVERLRRELGGVRAQLAGCRDGVADLRKLTGYDSELRLIPKRLEVSRCSSPTEQALFELRFLFRERADVCILVDREDLSVIGSCAEHTASNDTSAASMLTYPHVADEVKP